MREGNDVLASVTYFCIRDENVISHGCCHSGLKKFRIALLIICGTQTKKSRTTNQFPLNANWNALCVWMERYLLVIHMRFFTPCDIGPSTADKHSQVPLGELWSVGVHGGILLENAG